MSENASEDCPEEKPVVVHSEDVLFPPFPDPTEVDFDDDIPEDERNYYKENYKDLNIIKTKRLHCTACDRHLGCAARNESRMRPHPMLRTLVCHTCHNFYNSGEFEKGDDGSELYCRWCGQGGQVYCCSDCPHVFCARCIRRNLGSPKIKEIEQTDDWKCFKCNPKSLWDIRAMCWAVLRYCDQKNKIAYNTQDPEKKDLFQKDCAIDHTECCKNRNKKKELRKKESENTPRRSTAAIISKISPAIQVKKFASIVPDIKLEKKPHKRPASPKQKPIFIKNSIPGSGPSMGSVIPNQQLKKIRMTPPTMMNTPRFPNEKKINPIYISRVKSQRPPIPIRQQYNGSFNNSFSIASNDNINLSLDNLTQGLDMAAVAAMSSSSQDDDVVCTPDLPLEPMCEVTEDSVDDDVQCITPGPITGPKVKSAPILTRSGTSLPELIPENIVQMTENDVTVNTATGGLKFRVDPQTLSSHKMYRLPDGRVFAIAPNSSMPGGYSATIVAVTEDTLQGKASTKGATFSAKLSAVTTAPVTTPSVKTYSSRVTRSNKKHKPEVTHTRVSSGKPNRKSETTVRECDLNVPIEWYRYNLIDAVDALEYSLSRLHKLKREATTVYLRTRNVNEMRYLHRTLDRLLFTSVSRFNEVRQNVNKEMKQYVAKKKFVANNMTANTSEEDDDVEILPDLDDNDDNDDDPIFIDENSSETITNENQEVDLTGAASDNSPDKTVNRTNTNHDNNDSNAVTDIEVGNFNVDVTNHDYKDGEDGVKNEEADADDDDLKKETEKKDLNGDMDEESDLLTEHKDDHNTDENIKELSKNTTNDSEMSGGDEDLEKLLLSNDGNDGNDGKTISDAEEACILDNLEES